VQELPVRPHFPCFGPAGRRPFGLAIGRDVLTVGQGFVGWVEIDRDA
jgi:hypothetical protein